MQEFCDDVLFDLLAVGNSYFKTYPTDQQTAR